VLRIDAALTPVAAAGTRWWYPSQVTSHACVVLETGVINCWAGLIIRTLADVDHFLRVPTGIGATKFTMVRVAGESTAIYALTDSGAVVVTQWGAFDPTTGDFNMVGVHIGGFLEFAPNTIARDRLSGCAILGDGEITCIKWTTLLRDAPLTALGWRNLTLFATKAGPAACWAASPYCITSSGPYRNLVVEADTDFNGFGIGCAVRVNDSIPFCFGNRLPAAAPLPNTSPAMVLPVNAGRPVSRVLLTIQQNQLLDLHVFGVPLDAGPTMVELWRDASTVNPANAASTYSGVTDVGQTIWEPETLSFAEVREVRGAAHLFAVVRGGQLDGGYTNTKVRRHRAYQQVATWSSFHACALTLDGVAECFQQCRPHTACAPDQFTRREMSPFITGPMPGVATMAAGFRGSDTFCAWETVAERLETTPPRTFTFRNLMCKGQWVAAAYNFPVRPERYSFFPHWWPIPPVAPKLVVSALATGYNVGCAIANDTQVWCWDNGVGMDRVLPAGTTAKAVSIGLSFICTIALDDSLPCASLVSSPQVPNAAVTLRASLQFTSVAAAQMFGCGVVMNGSVLCFGAAADMTQLAARCHALQVAGTTAVAVLSASQEHVMLAGPLVNLSAGDSFVCGLHAIQLAPVCFGTVSHPVLSPPAVSAATLTASAGHACVLDSVLRHPVCWGDDGAGQVRGPNVAATDGLRNVASLVLSRTSTCASTWAGEMRCWGLLGQYVTRVRQPSATALERRRAITLAATVAWLVSPGEAAGDSCRQHHVCTSLAEAVSDATAASGMSFDRVIVVRGATLSPPVTFSATAPGLFVMGEDDSAGVTFIRPPTAAPTTPLAAITLESDGVTLANLRLTSLTQDAPWAAVIVGSGSFVSLVGVNVTGWNITSCAVCLLPRGVAAGARAAGTSNLPSVVVARSWFVGVAAPLLLNVVGHGSVMINGSTLVAQAPSGSNASRAMGLFVSCGLVTVINSTFIGFTARHTFPAWAGLGLAGTGAHCAATIGVSNTDLVRVSTSTFRDVSAMADGCGGAAIAMAPRANTEDGNLDVQACRFYAAVTRGGGGAIWWAGQVQRASVFLHNVDIVDAAAGVDFVTGNQTASAGEGGAIAVSGMQRVVLSMVTIQRTRGRSGGAVAVASSAALIARHVETVDSRVVAGHGGVMDGEGHGGAWSVVDVASTDFGHLRISRAHATSHGGAIFVQCGLSHWTSRRLATGACFVQLTDSQVSNASSAGGDGGCVAVVNTATSAARLSLDMSHTTLLRCTAPSGLGGGLRFSAAQAGQVLHSLRVVNSTVSSCDARDGGGIAVSIDTLAALHVTLHDATLHDNAAAGDGGGLLALGVRVNMSRSLVSGNRAAAGGGLALLSCTAAITCSLLTNNSARERSGGAVLADACFRRPLELRHDTPCTWPNSTAATAGLLGATNEAAWMRGDGGGHGTPGVVLSHNKAALEGGAISLTGCSIDATHAAFVANSAGASGGAVAATVMPKDGQASFAATMAMGNVAALHGGFLAIASGTATVQLCQHMAPSLISVTGQPWAMAAVHRIEYARKALDSTVGMLGAECAMVGNVAGGRGGDVWVIGRPGFPLAVLLRSWVALGSVAHSGGGSVHFSDADDVRLADAIFTGCQALSRQSRGGAAQIVNVTMLSVNNTLFSSGRADYGGAVAIDFPFGRNDSRTVLQPWQPSPGQVVVSPSVTLHNNSARLAGGAWFTDYGAAVHCPRCVWASEGVAEGYGPRSASAPHRVAVQSSLYVVSVNPHGLPVLRVIPNQPVESPLMVLNVTDAFGQLVTSDDTIECSLTGQRLDIAAPLSLGFQGRYQVVGGRINIFPFVAAVGPGAQAMCSLSCTSATFGGAFLPVLFLLSTSGLTFTWEPGTLAASQAGSLAALPSTARDLYEFSVPVAARLQDEAGEVVTAGSVQCRVALAAAWDGAGGLTEATIVGNPAAATQSGRAVFAIGIRSGHNVTAHLHGECTWSTGDRIATSAALRVQVTQLAVVHLIDGGVPCHQASRTQHPATAVAACQADSAHWAGTPALQWPGCAHDCWIVAIDGVLRWLAHGGAPLLPPLTAMPSPSDVDKLQRMAPEPAVAIVAMVAANGSNVVWMVPRAGVQCSAGVTRASGQAVALAGRDEALTNTTGAAAFPHVAVTGEQLLGASLSVQFRCRWVTDEALTSRPRSLAVGRIHVEWKSPPPAATVLSTDVVPAALSPSPAVDVTIVTLVGVVPAVGLRAELAVMATPACRPPRASFVGLLGAQVVSTDTDANGTAVWPAAALGGPFGSCGHLAATVMWLTGERVQLPAPTVTTMLIVSLTWLQPPPNHVLYAEVVPRMAVTAQLLHPDGHQLPTVVQSSPMVDGGQIACMLASRSTTVNALPVTILGNPAALPCGPACLGWSDVSWTPPEPSSPLEPLARFNVSMECQFRGQRIPGSPWWGVEVMRLRAVWQTPPPPVVLPSMPDPVSPWAQSTVVAIVDDSGAVAVRIRDAVCTLSLDSAGGYVSTVDRGQCAGSQWYVCTKLVGQVVMAATNGTATFTSVNVDAPFQSWTVVRAQCSRTVGGIIFPTFTNITVTPMSLAWVPAMPIPAAVLYNSPVAIAIEAVQRASAEPLAGLSCFLTLQPTGPATTSARMQLSSAISTSAVTGEDGQARFWLSVVGGAGQQGLVSATCSYAGKAVRAPDALVTLDAIRVRWEVTPPPLWVSSYPLPTARNPVLPVPRITAFRWSAVNDAVNGTHASVDLRCQVNVVSSMPMDSGALLEAPAVGYVLYGAASHDNATSQAPRGLTLPGIMFSRVVLGGHMDLQLLCRRAEGDDLDPLPWRTRFPRLAARWVQTMPAMVVPQRSIFMSVELVDVDGESHRATLDNSTTCTLQLAPGTDPGVVVQNPSATAVAGLVAWRAASIGARSGMTVAGSVVCSVPGIMDLVGGNLTWTTLMLPCGPGTYPVGFGCAVCPSKSYSPGGPGVVNCTQCPRTGVQCAGGLPSPFPGYFRVDGSALAPARAVVDSNTELHLCRNPAACIVNVSMAGMPWEATHWCAEGYTGPLCGVCASGYAAVGVRCIPCTSPAINNALLVLLVLAFAAFVVWVGVFRRVSKMTSAAVLTRILITYVQTLGTLGSMYVARGTAVFRQVLGFSEAVADSPLLLPPVQCIVRPGYHIRFAVTLGLPVIVAALTTLTSGVGAPALWWCARRCCKARAGQQPTGTSAPESTHAAERPDAVSSLVFVANLFFASIATSCFTTLNCNVAVGGKPYLAADLSVACDTVAHRIATVGAAVGILLFGGGVPLSFAFMLQRQRQRLDDPIVFRRFGFLYDGYDIRRGLYWWEAVVMVRKALVIAIGALTPDPFMQLFSSTLLLVAAVVLQAVFRPYSSTFHNTVELAAQAGILGTVLVSMFYLRADSQRSTCSAQDDDAETDMGTACSTAVRSAQAAETGATVVLLLINFCVVLGLGLLIVRASWTPERAAKLQSLRRRLPSFLDVPKHTAPAQRAAGLRRMTAISDRPSHVHTVLADAQAGMARRRAHFTPVGWHSSIASPNHTDAIPATDNPLLFRAARATVHTSLALPNRRQHAAPSDSVVHTANPLLPRPWSSNRPSRISDSVPLPPLPAAHLRQAEPSPTHVHSPIGRAPFKRSVMYVADDLAPPVGTRQHVDNLALGAHSQHAVSHAVRHTSDPMPSRSASGKWA